MLTNEEISKKFKEFEDWLQEHDSEFPDDGHHYALVHYDNTVKCGSYDSDVLDYCRLTYEEMSRYAIIMLARIYKNYDVPLKEFMKAVKKDILVALETEYLED